LIHPGKKGIRALGISESFRPGAPKSTLAGVVMRTDLVVDGFVLGTATVGGDDATSSVMKMYRALRRQDLNIIMLNGCVISRYNIIDLDEVARRAALPLLCLTYNESGGIEEAIKRNFADPAERLERYKRLGERSAITLRTGQRVYVRNVGIGDADAKRVLESFVLQGGIPEPVRVAKLLARAAQPARRPSRTLR
jgi:endonuclease V-like protein UPF0215 family